MGNYLPRLFAIGLFIWQLGSAQGSVQIVDFTDGAEGSIDWSFDGLVQAPGFGLPAASATFDAQKELTACRAAQITGQARLLEIIEGVSIYEGASITEREGELIEDTIRTEIKGVLVGAVELPGSRKWDAEKEVCQLIMTAHLANVREAIPPLGLSADGNLIIIDGATGPNLEAQESLPPTETQTGTEPQTSETSASEPPPSPTETTTESQHTETTQQPSQPAPSPTPPVANEDQFTVMQGSVLEQNVLANDTNLEGGQVNLVGNAAHGSLSLNSDGSFSYQATGSSPTDVFKYRLTTPEGSAEAFVTITISSPPATAEASAPQTPTQPTTSSTPTSPESNSATNLPIAQNDSYTVTSGGTVSLNLFANDSSPTGSPLSLSTFGTTPHGRLSLDLATGHWNLHLLQRWCYG